MVTRIKRKERITKSRRKQILRAALSVFSTRGYGESTMADVAAAAGVGVGTLYNYYSNKRDLLISLIQSILISFNLLNIFNKMTGEDTRTLMTRLMEDRLELGFNNVQTIIFLMFEVQRDAKLRHMFLKQVIAPLIVRIEDFIRIQSGRGAFRDVDERVVARVMTGSIIGSMLLLRMENRDSPFKKAYIKEIATEMSSLFLDGLERR